MTADAIGFWVWFGGIVGVLWIAVLVLLLWVNSRNDR